jgi:hypothetical protein
MAKSTSESPKMYCPRCDRLYYASTPAKLEEKVKKHVMEQHPDHDPEWYDTYPHPFTD